MLFIWITSLLALSFLPRFMNVVLELLVLCELVKLKGKRMMKKDKSRRKTRTRILIKILIKI